MEGNILAYQDLLMVKEAKIRELTELPTMDKSGILEIEVKRLVKEMEVKNLRISELENKKFSHEDFCNAHDSGDELTEGACTKSKLKRRVFKKVEQLNESIKNEIEPKIRKDFEEKLRAEMHAHFGELEKQRNALNEEHRQRMAE